jgi:hypothetical protein
LLTGLEGNKRRPCGCLSIWIHGYAVMSPIRADHHVEEESATASKPPVDVDAGSAIRTHCRSRPMPQAVSGARALMAVQIRRRLDAEVAISSKAQLDGATAKLRPRVDPEERHGSDEGA